MEKKKDEQDKNGQLFVWQGYTGKVELISFKTFLTKPVRRVALGGDHSLILTYDDCLFACGSNEHGQLGCLNLGREYSFDPCLIKSVSGTDIQHISCGTNHSACITSTGSLFMWGDNQYGQCAQDPSNQSQVVSPSEVQLSLPDIVCTHDSIEQVHKISCGAAHNVALSMKGKIWVWGKGPALGLGAIEHSFSPVVLDVFSDKSVIDICSGDYHCVVLVVEGKHKLNSPPKGESSRGSQEFKIDRNNKLKVDKMEETEVFIDNKSQHDVDIGEINVHVDKPVDDNVDATKESQGDPANDEKHEGEKGSLVEPVKDVSGESENAKEEKSPDDSGNVEDVELRPKNNSTVQTLEDLFTASTRSDSSLSSSFSGKVSRSKSFLDETGAREFLARQFQDDDDQSSARPIPKNPSNVEVQATNAPSSPGAYMMQTVSTLTSHVSSMTTKALSNIASVTVPAKFKFTSAAGEEESRSSTENISENSDLDTGSAENLSKTLDKSVLDFSNLTVSDTSLNDSQLSLPDSEKSTDGDEVWLPQSPVRSRPLSNKKSVSRESLSLRTIEAKQENLKRKSLSFLASDEKLADKEVEDRYTLNTEVWTWGRNSKGQLGLGDMLERPKPYCLQILSGRRIVKLACGTQHTLALSSTGEVYSWGQNDCGQLGHNEICSSPARLEITSDFCVWCLDAGSNHSVFLVDNAGTLGTRPDVFYTGKHPCKDLYVPVYKTQKLTPLKFLKKSGWIVTVATGGDNCSCIARQESLYTQIVFELTRFMRELHRHTHKITQDFVKRMQMSGYITGLEVQPYKTMIDGLLSGFIELSTKIGSVSVDLTDKLRTGDSVLGSALFNKYEEFVAELKKYSTVYEDMVAAGGFEYCVKGGSSLFETLQEFYCDLLKETKSEAKPDHSKKFRQIMYTPLEHVKPLSMILNKYSEVFEKSSRENNLVSSVHLNLEHFIRTSQTAISDADNTRMFWESSASKISESLRSPTRRLMKESRSCPLSLHNAGRFSSHVFYLFNDIFIHAQYSSYQSYPLATVWIDIPTSETSSSQNFITVTTPEDTLSLTTTSSQLKVEWAVAFNTAINKVLAGQRSVNRQNSGERVHTPVIRLAPHTFTKHTLFRDATYKGYWLNGKVHGSGIMKWPDGRKYKGKFKHGSITGHGCMLVPKDNDGRDIQEGVWNNGRLHGHGQIKYNNGDLYEGYFKDGLRHGHGVYRKGRYLSSASFVYVGEWLFDKKHGYGVMDDILKGEKYMGMWQEDNRHGDGVVVTLDGMYFEGNFQNNKLVGHGLMLTDDNSCYEGEFAGITMLQGKGCLIFPSGDKIEGTFNGTWNQGLKISGVFHKLPMSASMTMKHSWTRVTMESKSSLFGKLCVRPERKWEEIFYQCYECLHYIIDREPNTHKAWDQVVSSIVAGKQHLKEKDKGAMSSKQKLELSNLEQLEKIPTHSVALLTVEHMASIVQYLNKACETYAHPLGKLVKDLVDVFRAAYIGIGAHPRLLYHAVQEIQSFIRRIFKVIRLLFPELPVDGGPSHIYPERKKRASTPMKENMGFIQRQISETEDDAPAEVVSSAGILQPILLPKIYPALFDLYALHSDREDDRYWDRMQKLNKQGDISLMAYLGIDQNFWCLNKTMFEKKNVRISSIRDHSYSKAVDVLQQISTAFCPVDKLQVIQRTFLAINQSVQEYSGEEEVMLCMDDLFPIFQYIVIRSRIHHLGAEIHFIEDLMESYLEFGELGIMFTTLKACYYQIQNEKMPIH